ncbi:serine/threonine protein kinase, partial [Myxococcota bacterium]|nr:serine/threonine protein kinase [Myxococcota bacterium]
MPTSVAGYRVDGVLGQGSTGIVLRVHDEALDRPMALKLLAEGLDDDARARFLVEARAAGRIIHPNVVQVYAVGTFEGRAFITQELVDGWPLSALLDARGALSPAAVIDLGIQAARGLGRAAEVGVVHRDVKPQNLLVTEAGLVKLADFGVAKIVHAPTGLTDTGTTLGTPHYMSPEQGLGQDVDARSDQYALGATLYHLITGRAPFDADNALAVLLKHVQEPLVPVQALAPGCPVALAAVVERMLAKDRAERFESFDAVIEALEAAATALDDGAPEGALETHDEVRRGIAGLAASDAPIDELADATTSTAAPAAPSEQTARTSDLAHDVPLGWGTAEARALVAALVVAVAVVVVAVLSDHERDRPRALTPAPPPTDVAWTAAVPEPRRVVEAAAVTA